MKIKTSELKGAALDLAVVKCEGFVPFTDNISWIIDVAGIYKQLPKYSTDWSQGGPIIEREKIIPYPWGANACGADRRNSAGMLLYRHYGRTYLEAAMRCYVASKLGDEVDVPEEVAA